MGFGLPKKLETGGFFSPKNACSAPLSFEIAYLLQLQRLHNTDITQNKMINRYIFSIRKFFRLCKFSTQKRHPSHDMAMRDLHQ